MTTNQWLQIIAYFVVLLVLAIPLGAYMAKVYENKPFFLDKWFGWLEKLIYRLCGVKPKEEMDWKGYALAMLFFNIVGGLVLYAIERFQASLPLNPAGQSAVPPDLAFNTAISFITNTNWQFYGGESTMSYLTQMAGLAVHNFLCAASGMATLVALIRGIVRKETKFLGNFWVDMTRGTIYILLPLSLVFAMVLIQQGAPQTFGNTATATLVQPTSYDQPVTNTQGAPVTGKDGKPTMTHVVVTEQPISLGPVASQEAIKMLGTNGGGYYNVNSAHPYENPTPMTDFLELLAILLIPAALCFTFGAMAKDSRQGWAILAAMFLLLAPMLYLCGQQEQSGNPLLNKLTAGTHGE
ncbi:MAG TPA: potassium-transporting ATPase subunit KdpA, partial [bacterium]